ncbi:MAG: glycosyl hydrolase-related protein, partial [Clostridia bacterium]|nr:glycosyl hydrolase-related protein [Clostridia bacterium]
KNLMRNRPHDSICGGSDDAVHQHMAHRYQEIFEFAGEQLRRAMLTAGEHTQTSRSGGENDYLVTVANTQSFPLSGVVRVRIRLATADDMEAFRLIDGDGKNIPFRLLSKKKTDTNVYSPINLPGKVEVWDQEIAFDAGEVAPYAFKTFLIVKADKVPSLASPIEKEEKTSISNGLLSLSFDDSGRLTLKNIRTGRTLDDFLDIEDRADRGNAYTFTPGGDQPLHKDAYRISCRVIEANDLSSAVSLHAELLLPASYDFEKQERAGEALSTLDLTLRLVKDEPYLHVDYDLDNPSSDHRLRLVFKGDAASDRAYADIPFEIVSHTEKDFYPGTPARLSPNASFAAIEDEKKGFAVLTVGAHEYEKVSDDALAFTILRATGTIDTGGTENWLVPGNQCLRRMAGRMAFCPFEGDLIEARIPQISLAFRAPLLAGFSACDTRKFAGGRPCVQDSDIHEYFYLPDEYPEVSIADNASLLKVEGDGIVVSALKKSEDESGLILRLVNLSSANAEAKVTYYGRIFRTRMDEVSRSILGRGSVSVPMRSNEILTLFLG